jgi:hypothetical protein
MEFWKNITDILTSPTFGFVLKLVAGLSATAFGVFGIGAKARDDKGKLTRQGWVALYGLIASFLIGAASGTYDFAAGQKAAIETRLRNDRLLLAAERGIYPLRGITATASIKLPPSIPGLAEYKSLLQHALPASLQNCSDRREYACDDDTESYDINVGSPLFPKPASDFGKVLKYLGIHAALIRSRPESHNARFTNIGTFYFSLRAPNAQDTMLVFTPSTGGSLTYVAAGVRLLDREAMDSGVYSLADIFPGAFGASVTYDDKPLCDSRDGIRDCGPLIDPLKGGMRITRLKMIFDYPKALDLDSSKDIECNTRSDGIMIVRLLPPALDDVDGAGDFMRPTSIENDSKAVCAYVDRPFAILTP